MTVHDVAVMYHIRLIIIMAEYKFSNVDVNPKKVAKIFRHRAFGLVAHHLTGSVAGLTIQAKRSTLASDEMN